MANERITEDIVRKHFNSYSDECTIEEQKSSNPKIDKLLKNASKKGGGKGHPEFIISSLKNNPDFIIVVECKANIAKHQSSTSDKYDEYAVDGALLYALTEFCGVWYMLSAMIAIAIAFVVRYSIAGRFIWKR